MEKQEFSFERRPEAEEAPKPAERILADIAESYLEHLRAGRGFYDSIRYEEIIAAAEAGGAKEKRLERINPDIEYFTARSRELRELFYAADYARTSREGRVELRWIWGNLENSREEIKSIKEGALNQAQAVYLLENQGFEVRFAKPIEDAKAAVDLYARHPEAKDAIFAIQVKPEPESLRPYAVGLENLPLELLRHYEELRDPYRSAEEFSDERSLKRMIAYTRALRERYRERFIPMLMTVPSARRTVELDPITAYPNQAYLDKHRGLVSIRGELRKSPENVPAPKEVRKHAKGPKRIWRPGKGYEREARI